MPAESIAPAAPAAGCGPGVGRRRRRVGLESLSWIQSVPTQSQLAAV